jgi:hypothetical protein
MANRLILVDFVIADFDGVDVEAGSVCAVATAQILPFPGRVAYHIEAGATAIAHAHPDDAANNENPY